jgi:hypothetical protein
LATAEGEPLVSLFTPDEFAALLDDNGFDVVEDVGAEDIEARFGPQAIATAEERIALARSR